MKINASNSYQLIKEEVNNTFEVLKDGLSIEEISDIILHDEISPAKGMYKMFLIIAIANLEAKNDIMEDRILTRVAMYMDYFGENENEEFFMVKQELLYDDLLYVRNKYFR